MSFTNLSTIEAVAGALERQGLISPVAARELAALRISIPALIEFTSSKFEVAQDDMLAAVADVLSIVPINVRRLDISRELAGILPSAVVTRHRLLPISRHRNKLYVAVSDPLDVVGLDSVRRLTKLEIVLVLATEKAIQQKIEQTYSERCISEDFVATQEAAQDTGFPEQTTSVGMQREFTVSGSEDPASDAPIIKLAHLILARGIQEGASDIHIEPSESGLRLRYRIDGDLIETSGPPRDLHPCLVSRLKIMSNLNIAERRIPQDGRMRLRLDDYTVDVRVSFLPTIYGEKCVLRILDQSAAAKTVKDLGLSVHTYDIFRKALDAPHGLLLVTGPTGSGKTTTLYAALRELNQPKYNIVTVEDPVEYHLPGANQVSVAPNVGLTFATALRAILRQDPDVLMIGEIRDRETAGIAVEAALTGHQVLSTMHCNDAPSAITRLDEMEIAPFLIASSVILSVAQRLIRQLCPYCKTAESFSDAILEQFALPPALFTEKVLYRPVGCNNCNATGYSGRLAVLEVMSVSDAIRHAILQRSTAFRLRQLATSEGMQSLRSAAIEKLSRGMTSLEELLLVAPSVT